MPSILRLALVPALLAAPLLATPVLAEPGVRDARLYMALEGARSAAAYMVIDNPDGAPDRLIGASSPAASSVTLHGSEEGEDGVVRMIDLSNGVDLPSGGTIELAPGGLHVMLMGVEGDLAEGDAVPLTLEFESGPMVLDLPVDVQGGSDVIGVDAMGHMDHGADDGADH